MNAHPIRSLTTRDDDTMMMIWGSDGSSECELYCSSRPWRATIDFPSFPARMSSTVECGVGVQHPRGTSPTGTAMASLNQLWHSFGPRSGMAQEVALPKLTRDAPVTPLASRSFSKLFLEKLVGPSWFQTLCAGCICTDGCDIVKALLWLWIDVRILWLGESACLGVLCVVVLYRVRWGLSRSTFRSGCIWVEEAI